MASRSSLEWLQVVMHVDRQLWKNANFKSGKTTERLSAWLNEVPSQHSSNGAILMVQSACHQLESISNATYHYHVAHGTRPNLPQSDDDISESEVSSDEESVVSCAASFDLLADSFSSACRSDQVAGDFDAMVLDDSKNIAEHSGSLKRKTSSHDDIFLDQRPSRRPCIASSEAQPSLLSLGTQAVLNPVPWSHHAQVCSHDVGGSEQKPASYPYATSLELFEEMDPVAKMHKTLTRNLISDLTMPFGSCNKPDSTLPDEAFSDLWPYCIYRLHDPTSFESEACKTKRKAVSHVISHLINRHGLTRGLHHAGRGRSPKYLVECRAGTETGISGCQPCSRIAEWTGGEVVDNNAHSGPAICLRCYTVFSTLSSLWFHVRRPALCHDKGQVFSKMAKARLLYTTFCSKNVLPRWSPPETTSAGLNTLGGKEANHTPEEPSQLTKYPQGPDMLVSGLELEASNASRFNPQPCSHHTVIEPFPFGPWPAQTALDNTGTCSRGGSVNLPGICSDGWAYPIGPGSSQFPGQDNHTIGLSLHPPFNDASSGIRQSNGMSAHALRAAPEVPLLDWMDEVPCSWNSEPPPPEPLERPYPVFGPADVLGQWFS